MSKVFLFFDKIFNKDFTLGISLGVKIFGIFDRVSYNGFI